MKQIKKLNSDILDVMYESRKHKFSILHINGTRKEIKAEEFFQIIEDNEGELNV